MLATTTLKSPSPRTLANRRNAAKSTGPKTVEGKAVSRRNAVKHGLSGKGVVLPEAIQSEAHERTETWIECVRPTNAMEAEIVALAATTYTQIRYGWNEELLARARAVDRAELSWDLDREQEAAELGAKLSSNPFRTVARLKQTAHGAHWLLERWVGLAERLEAGDDWDDDTRTFALDLLATPRVFRDAHSPVDRPDLASNPEALRAFRLEVARDQIQILEDIIDNCLIPLDDDDREMCLANIAVVPDAEIRRLTRYQKSLSSRFTSLLNRIGKSLFSGRAAVNETKPNSRPASSPPFAAPRSMNQTNPASHRPEFPTAADPTPISALLDVQQPRTILPLREATPDADETNPFDPPQPAQTLASKTKPSATNPFQETTSASEPLDLDSTRHLLPPEFYQMSLDELHTAGGFLDMSDPHQAQAFRLLLRKRLIEQNQGSTG